MSKSNTITIKDILESVKKYGKENILTWNPLEYRDNKQKNKQAKFDCTWVPFKLRLANGKEVDLKRVKYMKVLTASAAKIPSASAEEAIKNLLVAFRKFKIEEIMMGDYAPKKKDTDQEQEVENARALKEAEILKQNTDEFNDAVEAIDLSYKRIADELKASKQLGFTLNKDTAKVKQIKDQCKKAKKKGPEIEEEVNKAVTVYSIRQTTYEDPETKEEVEMDHPFTRIKLMVSSKDSRIGTDIYNKDQGKYIFTPNVYDARKKDEKGFPQLAKVKVNGKVQLLDASTANSFITYKSMIGGIIEFSDIVVSKFGISLANKFMEMYVKRHKSSLAEPTFTVNEFKELQGSDDEDDDEVVVVTSNKEETAPDSDLEDEPLHEQEDNTAEAEIPDDGDEVISEDDD